MPSTARSNLSQIKTTKPTSAMPAVIGERYRAPHWSTVVQRAQAMPETLTPRDVLTLQRSIGNRATVTLLTHSTGMQAKLKLGPVGDKYEQEADRVAGQVVRQIDGPQPVQRMDEEEELAQAKPLSYGRSDLQRKNDSRPKLVFTKPGEGTIHQPRPLAAGISRVQRVPNPQFAKERFVQRRQEEEDEPAQRKPIHGSEGGEVESSVTQQIQAARGGGKPLDDAIRIKMEQGFGADFSSVRVHTGGRADTLNRSLNARAFTVGNDVFFGKGQYNSGSSSGQKLIAHELTHTVQQGDAGLQRSPFLTAVQRQSGTIGLIQRTPDLVRLEQKLGRNKFRKVDAARQTEYFDQLADDQLERYKLMQNSQFENLVDSLQESLLTSLGGNTATIAQIADLLGAAVETGEDAAQVIEMLPEFFGSMSIMCPALADSTMEGFGGFTGGVKDTYEGGSGFLNQHKYVEGGLTTLSGVSGLLSLVPGIPDFVGVAGAGAKSLAGVTKLTNIRINQTAINRLRTDGSTNTALKEALDVLEAKLDFWAYIEGGMQTGLGAIEGVGSMYGSVTKWVTGAISKGTETAYSWLPSIGRALGSYTGLVDSNTTVKENEGREKIEGKRKMWLAVKSVESGGNPEHIGRLHRLAVLIEPDYAEEISQAVSTLGQQLNTRVTQAIHEKATWNPT
jgi:hypothetical protein